MKTFPIFCLAIAVLVNAARGAGAAAEAKHRLVVLTDIENEPDDTESMVRLLLYSDVIDLQGLIATTSVHLKHTVAPDSIRAVIRAYDQARPNLVLHDPAYPKTEALLSLVSQGLPEYGMGAVGDGKDSAGSEWIIRTLKFPDERPLWISVWGGPNTLAQALFKLRATESPAELKRLVAKLRVYTISDQDDSGPWIRQNFPDLFYIASPGGYGAGTWTGMNQVVAGIDNTTVGNEWIAKNIQQGHGPLGRIYPDVAYGMEGDTPSWLGLIPNGLNFPEHPQWGGWGGRYELRVPELKEMDPAGFTGGVPVLPEQRPLWTNAVDDYTPLVASPHGAAIRKGDKSFKDFRATVWRWRDDFQNDFAARMLWATKPYREANHPPVPALSNPDTLTVKSGQRFFLDARNTSDPDGDSLSFYWFVYPEADHPSQPPQLASAANLARVTFLAAPVTAPETAHIILRVTDKGSPALSRYKRVIVTTVP